MVKAKPKPQTKTEPQLKISLEDTSSIPLFQKLISFASQILDNDITLTFTPTEFIIRNMDKGRFSMVDLKIQSSFFEEYILNQEFLMTIDLKRLRNILNCYRKNDTIQITFDEQQQLLLIDLLHDISRNYTIPLVAPETDPNNLPDPSTMEFDTLFKLSPKQLTNTINDIKLLAELISITANTTEVIFSSSKDKNRNKITIPHTQLLELATPPKKDISSSYPLDYLKHLILLDNIFEHNTIQFGIQRPLLFQGSNSDLSINYLIAPMTPDNEEEDSEEEGEDSEDWEDTDTEE